MLSTFAGKWVALHKFNIQQQATYFTRDIFHVFLSTWNPSQINAQVGCHFCYMYNSMSHFWTFYMRLCTLCYVVMQTALYCTYCIMFLCTVLIAPIALCCCVNYIVLMTLCCAYCIILHLLYYVVVIILIYSIWN